MLPRADLLLHGRLLHFVPVFVGTGQEEDVIAQLTMEPSQHIGSRSGVGVPDVRQSLT